MPVPEDPPSHTVSVAHRKVRPELSHFIDDEGARNSPEEMAIDVSAPAPSSPPVVSVLWKNRHST
jgi:hypothetical protein